MVLHEDSLKGEKLSTYFRTRQRTFFDAQAQLLVGYSDDVFVIEHQLFELFLQLLHLAGKRIGMLHHVLNKRGGRLFVFLSLIGI